MTTSFVFLRDVVLHEAFYDIRPKNGACLGLYIGRCDVTESMITIRSSFCGYNTMSITHDIMGRVKGEDLSCYSNKSVVLKKIPV